MGVEVSRYERNSRCSRFDCANPWISADRAIVHHSGTAVDRGAGHLERQPGCSKLLQFPNRGATVKNLDIPHTIAARSIKPYARRYVIVAENFRDAVLREYDQVKQPSLIASLEIVLKPTDILDELEQSPVSYK